MTDLREFTMAPQRAAAILRIRTETLALRARRGCIPYALTAGGHRRYRPDDVDYIAATRDWPPPGTYGSPS